MKVITNKATATLRWQVRPVAKNLSTSFLSNYETPIPLSFHKNFTENSFNIPPSNQFKIEAYNTKNVSNSQVWKSPKVVISNNES